MEISFAQSLHWSNSFVFGRLISQTCAIAFVWIYSALGMSGDQKNCLMFKEDLGDEFWGDFASIPEEGHKDDHGTGAPPLWR